MDNEKVMGHGPVCKCPHHKMVPILIILIGFDFLATAVGTVTQTFLAVTWPVLLIFIGIMKLVRCNCCSK